MTTATFGRTVATIVCTLIFSGTAIFSAVGPAQANIAAPTTHRTA